MINKARWQYCHFFNFFSKYTESEDDILNQVKLKPHNQETYDNLLEILYLIFDYPYKHYTFKYFEV